MINILSQVDLQYGSNLIILVGPPGCGKSTYAEKFIEKSKDDPNGWLVISPDVIRKEMTGDESDQSQNVLVFNRVYFDLVDSLDRGFNVVYDATNCRSTYRYKILDVAKGHANKVICVMFTTPMSVCLVNNQNRNRSVPEEVIERMYFTLKKHPPTMFEGYDAILKA